MQKKRIIRKSGHIIVHGSECLTALKNLYPSIASRISSANLGVYNIYSAWAIYKNHINYEYIFFWGWFTKRKGVDIMLEASVHLSKTNPGLKIIMAGKQGENILDNYKDKLQDNVIIIPRHIKNEELSNYINNASIVIVPYREARQSGVILTSYCFSKPVVASCINGLKKQVLPNVTGILIEPENPLMLAKTITDLISDKPKLKEMGKNIKTANEKQFSWDEYAAEVKKIFETIDPVLCN